MGNTQKLAAELERRNLLVSRLFLQNAVCWLLDRPHDQWNGSFQDSGFFKRNRLQGRTQVLLMIE